MSEKQRSYPIGLAAEECGLTQRQIRYYEQKGLITPERSPGGQRLFSMSDVNRLKRIRELQEKGYPLAVIRSILDSDKNSKPRISVPPFAITAGKVGSLFPVRNQAELFEVLVQNNLAKRGSEKDD